MYFSHVLSQLAMSASALLPPHSQSTDDESSGRCTSALEKSVCDKCGRHTPGEGTPHGIAAQRCDAIQRTRSAPDLSRGGCSLSSSAYMYYPYRSCGVTFSSQVGAHTRSWPTLACADTGPSGPYTHTSHAPVVCEGLVSGRDHKRPRDLAISRIRQNPQPSRRSVERERAAAPPVALSNRLLRTVRSPNARTANAASAGTATDAGTP